MLKYTRGWHPSYDICHVQYATHMRRLYAFHVTREYIYWKSEKGKKIYRQIRKYMHKILYV